MRTSGIGMAVAGHASIPGVETPVIDYEGSRYQTDFWEGQGRAYEDATERLALRQLLPAHGPRIAEIGAGFGRLADLYLGYEQIILFDYSRTLLQEAVQRWGDDPRFVFVAGNLYRLPLASGTLDSLVMMRVMHHLADVPQALRQLQRVIHRQSVAVLEYANKRNLKALLRWLAGRQGWSPLEWAPIEFVALNFDFHPAWMTEKLSGARLQIQQQFAVSHFRLPRIKQTVPAAVLAKADSWLYRLGGVYPLSPSVLVQATTPAGQGRAAVNTDPSAVTQLFCCPQCGKEQWELVSPKQLLCQNCGKQYRQTGLIWDFKEEIV
jgi:ubiquinone/menaquinone biosynthesis C-methylase UbiE